MSDQASPTTDSATATLTAQAQTLLRKSDVTGAAALLDRALDLEPENVAALIARGVVLREQAKWELALGDFSRAVSLRHDSHEGYFERAQTYDAWSRAATDGAADRNAQSERMQLAIRDYSIAFRIQPDAAYLVARGRVKELAREWGEARADYDRVLAVCREGDPMQRAALEGKQRLAESPGAGSAAGNSQNSALNTSGSMVLAQARLNASRARSGAQPETTGGATAAGTPSNANETDPAMAIARDIVDQFLLDVPIEYALATTHSFNDIDRDWYETTSADLIRLGFSPLGDFEPLHLTRSLGKRVLVRMLIDARRRTLAALSQQTRAQFEYVKSWPARLMPNVADRSSQIELESEMADGRFIVTSNTKGLDMLAFPSQVDVLRMQRKSSVGDLCSVHAERVREYKKAHHPMTDVFIRATSQAFELQERRRALTVKFRLAGGGLSGVELKSLLGSRYATLGAQVRAEIAQLLAAGGRPPPSA